MVLNFDTDARLKTFKTAFEAYLKNATKPNYVVCATAMSPQKIDNNVAVALVDVVPSFVR